MPKKSCINCLFFVQSFERQINDEIRPLIKPVSEKKRETLKKLDLDKLDSSDRFKCWHGIWQETAYLDEKFVKEVLLKNRRKYLFDDSCFFLDKEKTSLQLKAAKELVERRKKDKRNALNIFLAILAIVITILIAIL